MIDLVLEQEKARDAEVECEETDENSVNVLFTRVGSLPGHRLYTRKMRSPFLGILTPCIISLLAHIRSRIYFNTDMVGLKLRRRYRAQLSVIALANGSQSGF